MTDFFTRHLHDGYAALVSAVSPLRRVDEPPRGALIEQFRVQEAGSQGLDNRFEAEVLGTPEVTTHYHWEEASAYRLRDVDLVGSSGQVYFRDGTLFNVDPLTRREKKSRVHRRPIQVMARQLEGPILHLCGPNSENHGHFILDYLPKLIPFLPRFLEVPSAKILVSPGRKKWQCRYLAQYGIAEDRVVEMSHGTVHVDELWYVPILHAEDGIAKLSAPHNHLAVRDALSVNPKTGDAPVCIFASRLDAPNKRIENELRLVERAREILGDVQIVKASEHPLQEQLRLFSSAKVIIGAVGQNLTNVLFASGKLVIVMSLEERVKDDGRSWGRAYHNLALLAGNHSVLLLRDTPMDEDRNWSVDEDQFADVLARSWKKFKAESSVAC